MKARSVVILCVSVFGVMLFLGRKLFQWGYWVEGDQQFTHSLGDKLELRPSDEKRRNETNELASEICGEPVSFDVADRLVYHSLWTEQRESRHFFMYSPFSNVVWVTIGSPRYLCSARFLVTMKRHDCFWPFAYCNRWSYTDIQAVKLLSRTRKRSQVPPGARPLMFGECAMGRLEPGESTRYRTDVPEFGQYVNITARGEEEFAPMTHEETVACEERRKRMGMQWWPQPPQPEVTIERNGNVVRRCRDNENEDAPCPGIETDSVLEAGGGIFDITLKAQANTPVVYELVVTWNSQHGRDCPQHWDLHDKSKTKDSR